jgi:putative Holliday junction resolvase
MPPSTSNCLVALGFDVGEHRTGAAVGQTITGTATPLTTLICKDGIPEWQIIENLILQWQPNALVVGFPHTPGNNKGNVHKRVRRFCHCLRERFAISVYTHDESYTSVEAYRRLKSMRQSGRSKRISKAEIDSLAAAILLESWMAHSETTLDGVLR